MKKNFYKLALPTILCGLLITGGYNAFANEGIEPSNNVEIKNEVNVNSSIPFSQFNGTVSSIIKENGVISITLADEGKDILILNLLENSSYFDIGKKSYGSISEIKEGDILFSVLRENIPMTMSIPPQVSETVLLAKGDEFTNIKVDKFNNDLVTYDNSLKLNVGEETFIVSANGDRRIYTKEDLYSKPLCVFYTKTTFSIPPQTPPDAVIILDTNVDEAGVLDSVEIGLRELAEGMGYTVKWEDNKKPIVLQKDSKIVEVLIDSDEIIIDGNKLIVDYKPYFKDSKTIIDSSFSDILK